MPAMRARPGLGYALTALAAALSALNGPMARNLFDDGVSAAHLSEMRSAVAWALLCGWLAWRAPGRLRIARRCAAHGLARHRRPGARARHVLRGHRPAEDR